METKLVRKLLSLASVMVFSAHAEPVFGLGIPDPLAAQPRAPAQATPAPIPAPSPTTPSVSSVTVPLWESKNADGKQWTAHVINKLDTLGKNMLAVSPADIATFCPSYAKLSYNDKKWFWAYLISAMTKFESGFKPETSYQENFRDSKGNYVVSRGLLQISIESANGYGCGFKTAAELHDPYLNLSCGIRILNKWIGTDARVAGKVGSSWRGGARYWAVLRSTNKPYSSIVALTKGTSLCQ